MDTSEAALAALSKGDAEAPRAVEPERRASGENLSEPRPLSLVPRELLASLPPPPPSLPPLRPSQVADLSAAGEAEGFREPSITPPAERDATTVPTVIPPALSLTPPAPVKIERAIPAAVMPVNLSMAPEALELDLSVLGPSELPPASNSADDLVPVVELEEVELDEVRLSSEPSLRRRVAPPLPPPIQRRAR